MDKLRFIEEFNREVTCQMTERCHPVAVNFDWRDGVSLAARPSVQQVARNLTHQASVPFSKRVRCALIVAVCMLFSFTASAWEKLSGQTAFPPRDTAHGFVFDGKIWLSNGWTHSGEPYRDLWSSQDGLNWQQEVASTPYDAYSGIAVHKGAIIAANRSVWRSNNGRDWEKIGSTPLVRESSLPYLQSYNGKLYIFVVEGVWRSDDGISWEEIPTPEAVKRGSYAIAQFQGAIWLMGGGKRLVANPPELGDPAKTSYNDVWRFSEASGWQMVTASAPWGARMWPSAIVHDGRMFLIGGFDNRKRVNLDETWVTADGNRWERYDARPPFPSRHWPTLFALNDRILLVAGNGYPVQNDVWSLDITRACAPQSMNETKLGMRDAVDNRLAIIGPGEHTDDGKPGGLAGFFMPALLDMFETTRDVIYLDRFVSIAEWVLSNRDDIAGRRDFQGRSAPQWSTTGYNPEKKAMSYLIDDGGLVAPLARYAAIVRAESCLKEHRDRASRYIDEARKTMDFHSSNWREERVAGKAVGYFVTDCQAAFVLREIPCKPTPLNYMSMAGLAYVYLYQATGEEWFRSKAEALLNFIDLELVRRPEDDTAIWYYWPQLRWAPGKGFLNEDTSRWSYKSIEDLSHSTVTVDFLTAAYAAGLRGIGQDDLKRIANTFSKVVHSKRPLRLFIDGSGSEAGRYRYLHGRIAALSVFDPSLWGSVCGVLWSELGLKDAAQPEGPTQKALAVFSIARLMRFAQGETIAADCERR